MYRRDREEEMLPTGEVEVKDFTLSTENHPFRIGTEVFEIWPEMPLTLMGQLGTFANAKELMATAEGLEQLLQFFDEILVETAAPRFREGVLRKRIGLRHVMAVIPWALEVWGVRPTEPSSTSSDTSQDDAFTPSTAGASVAVSTA